MATNQDKKYMQKLPEGARLMTQEEATRLNNGGATLIPLHRSSKKSKPTEEKIMMKKVKVRDEEESEIYSPYTDQIVVDKDGEINEGEGSLLFVYYGMAGGYAYISEKLKELIDEDIENIDIEGLTSKITINEGTLLEVDCGWNGINYYGFVNPYS